MCLTNVYRDKKKAKILATLPKVGYYWKVVIRIGDKYYPEFHHDSDEKSFKFGWNNVKPTYQGLGYPVGFHAFRHKSDAVLWRAGTKKVVRCKIRKQNIIAVGTQCTLLDDDKVYLLIIVTKRIWMSKPN